MAMADAMAKTVPLGMERDGFFRSPDRLAPSMMPVAMGNRMENTMTTEQVPPLHAPLTSAVAPILVSVKFHQRFSAKFSVENPVTMVFVRLPSRHVLNNFSVHRITPDVAELLPM